MKTLKEVDDFLKKHLDWIKKIFPENTGVAITPPTENGNYVRGRGFVVSLRLPPGVERENEIKELKRIAAAEGVEVDVLRIGQAIALGE